MSDLIKRIDSYKQGDFDSTLLDDCRAEIERLTTLIDNASKHWMTLQFKHPIGWEGAIDGAMAAGCAEIERLSKPYVPMTDDELAKFWENDHSKSLVDALGKLQAEFIKRYNEQRGVK